MTGRSASIYPTDLLDGEFVNLFYLHKTMLAQSSKEYKYRFDTYARVIKKLEVLRLVQLQESDINASSVAELSAETEMCMHV